ncbi:MAG: extensin family protein [Hyphomicrobiaceae bacterium]
MPAPEPDPRRLADRPAKAPGRVALTMPLPTPDPRRKAAAPKPADIWSPEDVAAAHAECEAIAAKVVAEFRYVAPIRKGACGTPQPIEVRSVGSAPKVVLDPPAVMNCRMLAALSEWLRDTVEPEARRTLGAPVTGLDNASAYVCRNRYGAADQKLSEHALANALDIGAFRLEGGRRAVVAEHWGTTLRDAEAAEKARADKAAEAAARAKAAAAATAEPAGGASSTASGTPKPKISEPAGLGATGDTGSPGTAADLAKPARLVLPARRRGHITPVRPPSCRQRPRPAS